MNHFPPFNPFPAQAPQTAPQAPAQAPAQPGYGVPPGAYGVPQQAPAPFNPGPQGAPGGGFQPQAQGFAPPQQATGFGVPQAPAGYQAPPPVSFQAQDPSLDDKEEGPPVGMSSFECTGEVELGGQARNLLVVKLKTIQSQSVQPGTPFAFKRSLVPHARWGLKYASDEIGKFIVAILGLDKATPASQITPLINELVHTGKLGGQSLAGRKGVVTGTQKQLPPDAKNPQGKIVVNGTWQKHP
jgi:hypothetical protein